MHVVTEKGYFIAIDPGFSKCGFAVLEEDSPFLCRSRGVIRTMDLEEFLDDVRRNINPVKAILLGNGASNKIVQEAASRILPDLDIILVDEKDSNAEAREIYHLENSRGSILRRFLGWIGLYTRPLFDDYAAHAIGLRYLRNQRQVSSRQ